MHTMLNYLGAFKGYSTTECIIRILPFLLVEGPHVIGLGRTFLSLWRYTALRQHLLIFSHSCASLSNTGVSLQLFTRVDPWYAGLALPSCYLEIITSTRHLYHYWTLSNVCEIQITLRTRHIWMRPSSQRSKIPQSSNTNSPHHLRIIT